MKVNELMVGDLFRVNRDGLCIKKDTIVQIRGIDGDNKFEEKGLVGCAGCQPLDKTQFAGGIWLDYLDPIPITPEILEKNGWKGWIEHSTIARSISVLIEENTNLCIQEVKGQDAMFVQISHCGAGTFEFRKHLKFVHELQHALRLCGIDKEIII